MLKKWILLFFMMFMLTGITALGSFADTAVAKETTAVKETVDVTDLSKGIVNITYKATDTLKYKVLITKGDSKIAYPFDADGSTTSYPLQLGNGSYKIGLLKNVSGTKYVYVTQKTVELSLKDPNIVFLNSIQNIKWDDELKAIEFGKSLLEKSTTDDKRLQVLYGYLVKNVKYDYDKIPTLTSDYVPNVEQTYEDLKGICYDYSALFASIERSHGIPTKLVKGYSKYVEGYHAWNEIYINGKWVIVDNTVDSTWKGSSSSVTMIKNTKYYTKVNEY